MNRRLWGVPLRPDYEWTKDVSIGAPSDWSAEEWLRASWEGARRPLRIVLAFAWKYGLGLRLGPSTDKTRVLGWHIAETQANCVTVEAASRILSAENTIKVDGDTIKWRTNVRYSNAGGRLIWSLARVAHQFLVPMLVRRAIRGRDNR